LQVNELNNLAVCLLPTKDEKNMSSNNVSASGAGGTTADDNSIAAEFLW